MDLLLLPEVFPSENSMLLNGNLANFDKCYIWLKYAEPLWTTNEKEVNSTLRRAKHANVVQCIPLFQCVKLQAENEFVESSSISKLVFPVHFSIMTLGKAQIPIPSAFPKLILTYTGLLNLLWKPV